jgi:hypothetical protein
MKRRTMTMVVAGMIMAGGAFAATVPGSITREPFVRSNPSDRLSLGFGYDRIKREVQYTGSSANVLLEANSVSGFIGYDAARWLTVFVTGGGTSLQGDRWGARDYALRTSVGLHAYLWEGDVLSPAFAAGRISIKSMLEVVRHTADTSMGQSEWYEYMAAMPFGYEFFDRYPVSKSGLATSLALYVGPAVSYLDGDLAPVRGVKQSFKQEQAFGAIAGVDVYLAPTFSLGVNAQIFDETSIGTSFRFHF